MSDRGPSPRRRRFLERRTYRRHRLEDAARLAPILGIFLFFWPLVVSPAETGLRGQTAGWLIYFTVVWFALIVLAGALARALRRSPPIDGDR